MSTGTPIAADHLRDLLVRWARPGDMLTVALADSIAGLVARGAIGQGDRLPSALALSTSLHVSRPTVHDAYDLLSVQGIIDRRSRVITA